MKEHRRLLYVALTRAREPLVICGFETRKGVRPGSWYELCERAAQTIGTAVERDGETVLVLGDPGLERVAAKTPEAEPPLTLPDWAKRPAPEEAVRPRIIRPSEAVDGGGAGRALPARCAGRGTLPPRAPGPCAARAPAGSGTCQARAPRPSTSSMPARSNGDEAEALIGETLAVLDHPDFAPAFAGDARAEVAIVADLPELGAGRTHQWPHRPAGGDGRRGPRRRLQDQPPAAGPPGGRRPALPRPDDPLPRGAGRRSSPENESRLRSSGPKVPALMRLPDALLDQEKAAIRARLSAQPSPSARAP